MLTKSLPLFLLLSIVKSNIRSTSGLVLDEVHLSLLPRYHEEAKSLKDAIESISRRKNAASSSTGYSSVSHISNSLPLDITIKSSVNGAPKESTKEIEQVMARDYPNVGVFKPDYFENMKGSQELLANVADKISEILQDSEGSSTQDQTNLSRVKRRIRSRGRSLRRRLNKAKTSPTTTKTNSKAPLIAPIILPHRARQNGFRQTHSSTVSPLSRSKINNTTLHNNRSKDFTLETPKDLAKTLGNSYLKRRNIVTEDQGFRNGIHSGPYFHDSSKSKRSSTKAFEYPLHNQNPWLREIRNNLMKSLSVRRKRETLLGGSDYDISEKGFDYADIQSLVGRMQTGSDLQPVESAFLSRKPSELSISKLNIPYMGLLRPDLPLIPLTNQDDKNFADIENRKDSPDALDPEELQNLSGLDHKLQDHKKEFMYQVLKMIGESLNSSRSGEQTRSTTSATSHFEASFDSDKKNTNKKRREHEESGDQDKDGSENVVLEDRNSNEKCEAVRENELGCSFIEDIVADPDLEQVLTSACNWHAFCYSCGRSRGLLSSGCDNGFLERARIACNDSSTCEILSHYILLPLRKKRSFYNENTPSVCYRANCISQFLKNPKGL